MPGATARPVEHQEDTTDSKETTQTRQKSGHSVQKTASRQAYRPTPPPTAQLSLATEVFKGIPDLNKKWFYFVNHVLKKK